jgi:hypothetical protein
MLVSVRTVDVCSVNLLLVERFELRWNIEQLQHKAVQSSTSSAAHLPDAVSGQCCKRRLVEHKAIVDFDVAAIFIRWAIKWEQEV